MFRLSLSLSLLLASMLSSQAAEPDAHALSRQAADPTASLMALNFQTLYTGGYHGSSGGLDDDRWTLQVRPVIPFEAFGLPNVLRMTFPDQIAGRILQLAFKLEKSQNRRATGSVFD